MSLETLSRIGADDLRVFAEMGQALWADSQYSERIAVETLTACSLLELAPERVVEKAASALLDRASREGIARNTRQNIGVIGQPFFKLEPRRRFLLVALHSGRWSYEKLARVLETNEEGIQELAWASRLELAALGKKKNHPVGTRTQGVSCPEYDLRRPWTQKFLDDEISNGKERIFLQNHLMACSPCRLALGHGRDLYYAVESLIPRATSDAELLQNLGSLFERSRAFAEKNGIGQNLAKFFRRTDVRGVLLGLALVLALKMLT